MEEKLLELFKLADSLNEKQNEYYAQIKYTANNHKRLEITIVSRNQLAFVERFEISLNNFLIKCDDIIELFKKYIGGVANE